MLMFIPYLLFGKEFFVLQTDSAVSTLCANQFALAFIYGFSFFLYVRLEKIYTTRDGFEIIKNSENYMKFLVAVVLVVCIVFGCVHFKAEALQYIFLCLLHSLSVLACSGVIKRV